MKEKIMSKSRSNQLKAKIDIFELPKSQQYQLRNTYYSMDGFPTKEIQKNYLNYCDKLIDGMCEKGASPKELERALIFCYVVIDSLKCKLSILKAYDDLEIEDLNSRYVK